MPTRFIVEGSGMVVTSKLSNLLEAWQLVMAMYALGADAIVPVATWVPSTLNVSDQAVVSRTALYVCKVP